MGNETDITVSDGTAQIALTAGPSARLTTAMLEAIDTGLDRATGDPGVDIIVLRGKGPIFPSGITVPQGGGDDRTNRLSVLCRRIELCPKPVVMVLTGAVVGAGVELAIAAHYRLIHQQTRIGFPNARLGLVPSAGATQRLPRLLGAEATLDLLIGGSLMPVAGGNLAPLADLLFDDTPDAAIQSFTAGLRADGAHPRPTADLRTGFADGTAYQAAIARVRARTEASPEVAPQKILAAVEAAMLLPIEAGLAFEEAAAEDCSETEQSRALSHLFHAEQKVTAQTRRNDLPEIAAIGILGGSQSAVQIAVCAIEAGLALHWFIKDPGQHREAIGHVRQMLKHAVQSGRIPSERARQGLQALRGGDAPDILDGAQIVLRATRGQRGAPVPPGVPIAHSLPGTDPRLALHFAAPAATARLLEVVLGPEATEDDRRLALGLARRMNKIAVIQTTSGSALSERLLQTLWRVADALVDLGQSPFTIDAALRDWGMAHPPYDLADRTGLDIVARHARTEGAQNWSAHLLQLGRQGRADGRGFYLTGTDGTPDRDPDVQHGINAQRAPQSTLPPGQITRLMIGALANAGARALREGVVPRASDIDVLSVFAHLVPSWRGGVMHAAGAGGLLATTRAMQALDHPDRDLWTPDPVFAELIKNGRSFDDL
ncbi:MAG: enoyl-CoA hydratase-related protein [Marivita sp.]|uniref:enoyl-CoA hydratase/isomerase family protein n=1 Tax=Marivita sp. TaxID=2003365 RepID=UPI0025BDF091|nr:enoyl-CoA hydratase/isomerase family protein [Marivita sp.]MCI5112725.1 enoyl-CoA hydratase-related protein [Marivita sp.]